mmetsp:Transcript_19960/g.50627  ORF Transcript_19960/g.50627 Transcript_19960/m.50627 type:complete len:315 (+) Transcript_19960:4380-5324(+)
MMTDASDPPSEWPVSAIDAKGEVARCARTRGTRSSYRRSAAWYTPRCTRTPSAGSSKMTGSNCMLICQCSRLVEPWMTKYLILVMGSSATNHAEGGSPSQVTAPAWGLWGPPSGWVVRVTTGSCTAAGGGWWPLGWRWCLCCCCCWEDAGSASSIAPRGLRGEPWSAAAAASAAAQSWSSAMDAWLCRGLDAAGTKVSTGKEPSSEDPSSSADRLTRDTEGVSTGEEVPEPEPEAEMRWELRSPLLLLRLLASGTGEPARCALRSAVHESRDWQPRMHALLVDTSCRLWRSRSSDSRSCVMSYAMLLRSASRPA